jgi:hypothetical protein
MCKATLLFDSKYVWKQLFFSFPRCTFSGGNNELLCYTTYALLRNITLQLISMELYKIGLDLWRNTRGIGLFLVGNHTFPFLVVVLKRRSMHTTTNCYLFSLALADLLLLLSAALPATAQPFYIRDEWPWGHALCSLVVSTGSMFYPDTDSKTYPVRGMYSWLKKLPVIYSALKLDNYS